MAILTGMIAAGLLVAGLFFFRFWRTSRDKFFLYFALSFLIEAVNRIAIGLTANSNELAPVFYGVRVIAYGLIVLAILQKNRRS